MILKDQAVFYWPPTYDCSSRSQNYCEVSDIVITIIVEKKSRDLRQFPKDRRIDDNVHIYGRESQTIYGSFQELLSMGRGKQQKKKKEEKILPQLWLKAKHLSISTFFYIYSF